MCLWGSSDTGTAQGFRNEMLLWYRVSKHWVTIPNVWRWNTVTLRAYGWNVTVATWIRTEETKALWRWLSSGLCHRPDDGGSIDLWNTGELTPVYTALQLRRQPSSYPLPWEPKTEHLYLHTLLTEDISTKVWIANVLCKWENTPIYEISVCICNTNQGNKFWLMCFLELIIGCQISGGLLQAGLFVSSGVAIQGP
jgi:hypothetical protein